MKIFRSRRALTLFEATVSVLLLTVISFIIFKKFITLIEFSRCREAFENISAIRRSMEECYFMTGAYDKCSDLSTLNLANPNKSENAHFTYKIVSSSQDEFEIMATRTALDGGITTDTITLKKEVAGGVTRSGTGSFAGIR